MTTRYERTWETRRQRGGRTAGDESRASYYNIPVIHKPHWTWDIIIYFFLGGMSGASYAIATIAALVGGQEGRRIARAGRYLSFAAFIPSPFLLIHDLGRPERFHHMLRVLKIRSPMSVGSWTLTAFGLFCSLATLRQAADDGMFGRDNQLARLAKAIPTAATGALGLPFALFLSGYTGALLAITAVPLWARNHLLMGPLFLVSAMSNATAAIAMILALARGTNHSALRRLERLDRLAMLTELALLLTMRRRNGPIIDRPLRAGRLATIHRGGVIGAGIVAPLALQAASALAGRRGSRGVTVAASLLTLVGGFLFRYVMVSAGRASADDPQATFEFTRADRKDEG